MSLVRMIITDSLQVGQPQQCKQPKLAATCCGKAQLTLDSSTAAADQHLVGVEVQQQGSARFLTMMADTRQEADQSMRCGNTRSAAASWSRLLMQIMYLPQRWP